MNLRVLAGLICSIALSFQCLATFGQEQEGTYKPDEGLEKAIGNAKIITKGYPIRVMRNGDEVIVTTLENPRSTVRSSKIDAVLVAKAIMDVEKKVLIVHYRTKKDLQDDKLKVITVRQSDVMAYGVNAINVNNLLEQLKIVHRTAKHPGGG